MDRPLPADLRPLIVTARLDATSQSYFGQLRQQHYPSDRNYLPAHLTMFHALPANALDDVSVVLTNLACRNAALPAEVCGMRLLGSGVAFTICSPDLERVREEIAAAFRNRLTKQDAHRYRPHVTIQNKVSSESARNLMASFQRAFQPWTVSVEALDLWRYDGGPWEFVRGFHFEMSS